MDLSMSAVYSALNAAQQALAANAQDISNVNTAGYRPQMGYFQSSTTEQVGNFETELPWGVQWEQGSPSTQPGPLQSSPDPLHVALSAPEDYFSVQTPQGVAFTRDGDFHLDAQGNLLASNGDPVLGTNGPLQASGGQALIASDGSFEGVNPDGTFGGAGQDKLLVTSLAGVPLQRMGSQMFVAGGGQTGGPAQGTVLPGQLEGSGADTFKGMSDLVELMRWSESLEKAAQASDTAATSVIQSARLSS